MRTRICGLGWIGYIPAHTHTQTHEKRVTMNAIIVLTFTKIYSIDGLWILVNNFANMSTSFNELMYTMYGFKAAVQYCLGVQ